MNARGFFRVVMESEAAQIFVHLGVVQFLPEDHAHSISRPEKGKNFDSERSDNQVGMPGESYGETEGDQGQEQGDQSPCSVGQMWIDVPVNRSGC
jgi:hypothetical protein